LLLLKKKYIFPVVVLVLSVFTINSCNYGNKSNERVVYTFDVSPKGLFPDSVLEQVSRRIEKFGVKNFTGKVISDNRIEFELPYNADSSRLYNIIVTPGRLEFWETYRFSNPEIYAALIKADSISTIKSLVSGEDSLRIFMYLAPNFQLNNGSYYPAQAPVMGYCKNSDTAYINDIFSQARIKKLFPKEMKLMWGIKPPKHLSNSDTIKWLELFIIYDKYADNDCGFSFPFITNAKMEYADNGRVEINMKMNAKGAEQWKILTGNNIGKSIAIVIDKRVFAAPTVMDQIEGGWSQISGNFTTEEAKDITNILNSGAYNFKLRKISEKHIKF